MIKTVEVDGDKVKVNTFINAFFLKMQTLFSLHEIFIYIFSVLISDLHASADIIAVTYDPLVLSQGNITH